MVTASKRPGSRRRVHRVSVKRQQRQSLGLFRKPASVAHVLSFPRVFLFVRPLSSIELCDVLSLGRWLPCVRGQDASVRVKLLEALSVAGGFLVVSVLVSSLLKELDEEYEEREFWDTDVQDPPPRPPPPPPPVASKPPPSSTPAVDPVQRSPTSPRRVLTPPFSLSLPLAHPASRSVCSSSLLLCAHCCRGAQRRAQAGSSSHRFTTSPSHAFSYASTCAAAAAAACRSYGKRARRSFPVRLKGVLP